MSVQPAVSVVIPAYNAANFIERTLDSVRAQTFKDFETVVIDDGSSDRTCEIVERCFRAHAMPGLCLRQENKKIAGARNAGVRAARGGFVSFLDSDDRWYPSKLEAVIAEFKAHPETDVVCHAENVVVQGGPPRLKRYGPSRRDMYFSQLWGGCALSTSATTLRRRVFDSVGGFREDPRFNTVEDYDLWMRLGKAGCRFRFIGLPLGEYVVASHNSTRRIEYHHANLEALLRDHFRSCFGDNPGWGTRLRMRRRLASVHRSALGQLMQYGEQPDKQREHVLKMLRQFPFDPKNAALALLWSLKVGR